MSKMIPRRAIDTLRNFNDVSVDVWGIPCTLFIPSTIDAEQSLDIYHRDSQYTTYVEYTTLVWIEWSPSISRLRKFGVHAEKDIPIVARFKGQAVNTSGTTVNVDVTIGSYVVVSLEYVPGKYQDTNEFEVMDTLVGAMHDAIVSKVFKLAPRRVKPSSGS